MKKVTEINLVIGNAIRQGLQSKKMTQGDLAKIVGSTQRSISSYVNGNAQPPLDILMAICRVLEINLNHLLKLPDYDHPCRLLSDPKEIACLTIMSQVPKEKIDDYLEICNLISKMIRQK